MNLVTHKYTLEEMSEAELEATFCAREHTLSYLLNSLRDQISATTLSSFLLTGPRGCGKSTLLRMLRLRVAQTPELNSAWMLVPFPEEQFNVTSLRDLLGEAVAILARGGTAAADEWHGRIEAERKEEQSFDLAVSALRELSRSSGKRLILIVENLDRLFEQGLSALEKSTFRRLLMDEPFMLLIGSAVHVFDALRSYDEAFFNYFHPVPLERLTDDEVLEMLQKRGEYDHNEAFLKRLPGYRSQIKTIALLSGGNPRLIQMLYELLCQNRVASAVQQLRALVDELTPLLKHELEALPPQQQKIIHALMERGGTASPKDLTTPTRLSLNVVTTQLGRLKDRQILELRGGGKGRQAYYTVPDRLFLIWYQMRYLRQQRRRIEMFVEVLQIWFEAEERFQLLRQLTGGESGTTGKSQPEAAAMAEYFAASLAETVYETQAQEMALRAYVSCGQIRDAALAYAEFQGLKGEDPKVRETEALYSFGKWAMDHEIPEAGLEALKEAARNSSSILARLEYGRALARAGRHSEAHAEFGAVLSSDTDNRVLRFECPRVLKLECLFDDIMSLVHLQDYGTAAVRYSTLIEYAEWPSRLLANLHAFRGEMRRSSGDEAGAIADWTTVIDMAGADPENVVFALFGRGCLKMIAGQLAEADADFTAMIDLPGASRELVRQALMRRASIALTSEAKERALADFDRVINDPETADPDLAIALAGRRLGHLYTGNMDKANADIIRLFGLESAPVAVVSHAMDQYRWLCGAEEQKGTFRAVLDALLECCSRRSPEDETAIMTELLSSLAQPDTTDLWLSTWKVVSSGRRAEVMEKLELFRPVALVLETHDKARLDCLPPEQRDFAERILSAFEADSPEGYSSSPPDVPPIG